MPQSNKTSPSGTFTPTTDYSNYQENRPFPTPQVLETEAHSGTPTPISLNTDYVPIPVTHSTLPALDSQTTSMFLEDLNVALARWTLGLSWQCTPAKKTTLVDKLLKKPTFIDLDLSCVMYDGKGEVLERVWFKNVRDNAESIRHRGDSLTGMGDARTQKNPYAPVDYRHEQEQLDIYLPKLPKTVKFIAFVVSSFYGQAFNELPEASCHLSDDEGNLILQQPLHTLPDGYRALWLATLSHELESESDDNDLALWQFTANKQPLAHYKFADFEKEISQHLHNMLRGKFLPV